VVTPPHADLERTGRIDCDPEHTSLVLRAEPLPLERAPTVEDLNPRVLTVGDEHVTARPEREPVRVAELGLSRPFFAPLVQESAVSIEARDAAVHVAVRHVKRSVRPNGDVGGLNEMRAVPRPHSRLSMRE